jgi:polyphosphate kinase 2 (PPK2 family)
LKENIPGIDSLKKINRDFWENRLRQIRRFEKNLSENGMLILKFFLHISKKEQKRRFLERIDDPAKNWKFSVSDLKERAYWDDYQKAYDEAISATSTEHAPWFIIPADDKWFSRLAIAAVIHRHFDKLKLSYPTATPDQKVELRKAKIQLAGEDQKVKKRTRARD